MNSYNLISNLPKQILIINYELKIMNDESNHNLKSSKFELESPARHLPACASQWQAGASQGVAGGSFNNHHS